MVTLLILLLISPNNSYNNFINSVIYVESKGNSKAYNRREKAAGCLQIRPIMLRDINRILRLKKSTKRYKLQDRWNCKKSKQMFKIFQNHYHNLSFQKQARCWNGGVNGMRKPNTKKYWLKVRRHMLTSFY